MRRGSAKEKRKAEWLLSTAFECVFGYKEKEKPDDDEEWWTSSRWSTRLCRERGGSWPANRKPRLVLVRRLEASKECRAHYSAVVVLVKQRIKQSRPPSLPVIQEKSRSKAQSKSLHSGLVFGVLLLRPLEWFRAVRCGADRSRR
jgi:hypothetical protein